MRRSEVMFLYVCCNVMSKSMCSRGYCTNFQEFDDPRDADDAVYELNGRELLGER